MAIVLVDTLDDEPIDEVANRLYREWGIGKKGKDEGILLMLAVKDHKQRAEIGYGLEPIIPDGYAGGVLRGIRPILRQGNYGGALLAAAQEFGQKIAQEKGVDLAPEVGRRMAPTSGRGQLYTSAVADRRIFFAVVDYRAFHGWTRRRGHGIPDRDDSR